MTPETAIQIVDYLFDLYEKNDINNLINISVKRIQLQKKPTGKSLFILDEPTTGLHIDDIKKLLVILQRIVDNGDTVVVIEHNLDVIKVADYIIDLGPEGGALGGEIVCTGTPEEVAENPKSYTGQYLKKYLDDKYRV